MHVNQFCTCCSFPLSSTSTTSLYNFHTSENTTTLINKSYNKPNPLLCHKDSFRSSGMTDRTLFDIPLLKYIFDLWRIPFNHDHWGDNIATYYEYQSPEFNFSIVGGFFFTFLPPHLLHASNVFYFTDTYDNIYTLPTNDISSITFRKLIPLTHTPPFILSYSYIPNIPKKDIIFSHT